MERIIVKYKPLIQKHLLEKEVIDFKLSRAVLSIYMIKTDKRFLFFKKEKSSLNLIYDSDGLLEAWGKGKPYFKRSFYPMYNDSYLHLALSNRDFLKFGKFELFEILKEYILLNTGIGKKEIINIVKNYSKFFDNELDAFTYFMRAYLELGMLDESAELINILIKRFKSNGVAKALYYLISGEYEKSIFYISEAKKASIKRFKDSSLELYDAYLFWSMAMLDWKMGRFSNAYDNFLLAFKNFFELKDEFSSNLMQSFSKMALSKKQISDLKSLMKISKNYEFTPEEKKPEAEKTEYARMWTNQTKPEGDIITKEEFDKYEENKSAYQIFIIDRGELERNSIGEVNFGKKIIVKEARDKKKNKKVKIKTDITATEYRILFHTLKNGGRAGDIFDILKQCFPEERPPDPHKRWFDYYKKEPKIFWQSTRTYRKTIGVLSTFLRDKIGVEFQTRKKKIYNLLPLPSYCIFKII